MAKMAKTSHQVLMTTKSIIAMQMIRATSNKGNQATRVAGKGADAILKSIALKALLDFKDNDVVLVSVILVVLVLFVFVVSSPLLTSALYQCFKSRENVKAKAKIAKMVRGIKATEVLKVF